MNPFDPSQQAHLVWLGLSGIWQGTGWICAGLLLYVAVRQSRELARQKDSAREARLMAMRYQIEPNFLFHTLDTLSAMVLREDRERPHRTILHLCDFLRATLGPELRQEAVLRDELGIARKYLSIEAERLGERLSVEWEVDESLLDVLVPSLLLQSLVEHAMRHSIDRSKQGGKLWIRAWMERGALRLSVEEWHRDCELAASPGGDTGLENTRRRLEFFYGKKAELRMTALANGMCVDAVIRR